ncbi:hypothetical protein GMI70_05750 [Eggerthellaceae bacterium zg-893]|nr:hypothetical protein [Eggerthellaceae bacterium zg-893]
MKDAFAQGYDFFARSYGAHLAANDSAQRIADVNAEIANLFSDIESLGTSKSVDFLSGDIVEFLHAHTFNIDAILSESANRAEVPRVTSFASPDVVPKSGESFQIKYYANGEKSASAQSVSFEQSLKNPKTQHGAEKAIAEEGASLKDPIYKDMKRVIPEGQTKEAKQYLTKKIAKESQERPAEALRYQDTLNNIGDVVSDEEGITSKTFSREESKQIAREAKEHNLDLAEHGISAEQMLKVRHILSSSLKVGMSAAAIAAVLKIAPYVLLAIQEVHSNGEVDIDHIKNAGTDVLSTGGGAFISGALSSAIAESMHAGVLGEAFKEASPGIAASATVIAINACKNGIKVASGEMNTHEFADTVFRDAFVSMVALSGGAVGQASFPIPAIGYLLGSFIGSLLGGVAYGAGQNIFMSFAVDSGLTFFGLVDQSYELPESTLREIGIDIFEYDRFEYEQAHIDYYEPDTASIGLTRPELEFTFPRRGVIGIGRVGYII